MHVRTWTCTRECRHACAHARTQARAFVCRRVTMHMALCFLRPWGIGLAVYLLVYGGGFFFFSIYIVRQYSLLTFNVAAQRRFGIFWLGAKIQFPQRYYIPYLMAEAAMVGLAREGIVFTGDRIDGSSRCSTSTHFKLIQTLKADDVLKQIEQDINQPSPWSRHSQKGQDSPKPLRGKVDVAQWRSERVAVVQYSVDSLHKHCAHLLPWMQRN